MPPERFFSDEKVYSRLRELIFNSLSPMDEVEKMPVVKLDAMISELCYRTILEGESLDLHLRVLKAMKYALGHRLNYIRVVEDSMYWSEIVNWCVCCVRESPESYALLYDDLREDHPREYDVAHSVAILSQMGCRYRYVNGRLDIFSGLEDVILHLERLIERIGGLNMMTIVFQHLESSGRYSKRFERFHIHREGTFPPRMVRQVPYGYLLHLCLKYPFYRVPPIVSQDGVIQLRLSICQL